MRLLFISLLFISCNGNACQTTSAKAASYQVQFEQSKSDQLLQGIQGKIMVRLCKA